MKSRETSSGGDAARRQARSHADHPGAAAGRAVAGDAVPETLDERVLAALAAHGVPLVEPLGRGCFRLRAVPMAPEFNKPRTNVLLRRIPRGQPGTGAVQAFVDEDLVYTGSDRTLACVLGPVRASGWRAVALPPPWGDVPPAESISSALCRVLEVLRSPVAADARRALGDGAARAERPAGEADHRLTPLLATVGEVMSVGGIQRAYETAIRQALADELAAATTRLAAPRSAVLWGPSGSGCHHLMLAAGWPLLRAGRVAQVVRVSGARVAAGGIFAADVDAALMRFLTEAVAAANTAFLIRDLDLALTGSGVGYSLLAESMDAGLALVATASSESALVRLRSEPRLARRLWAVRLKRPSRDEVMAALGHLAAASPVPVEPAAVQTAWAVTHKAAGTQPAAAIGILAAAIAKAAWRGAGARVDPDDVLAVPPGEWPEEAWQKG